MTTAAEALRERTHTWSDPMRTAAAAAEVDGLTFIRMLAAGEVPAPPITSTLGFELVPDEVEAGRVVFAFEPAEHHFNPIGSVHGGVFATLLDSAAGCAVHTMLPAGARYTSLDLSVKFLRGLGLGSGRVRCVGRVLHLGGRTALAEAQLLDAQDRLVAHATSSCLIIRSA